MSINPDGMTRRAFLATGVSAFATAGAPGTATGAGASTPLARAIFTQIEGLTTLPGQFGAVETFHRLIVEVSARGLTVFARIDHAAGANTVGLALRPTYLLVFGNARGGTPLMQADQTMGLELPLKVLVWEDEDGQTQLSYNDLDWVANRHPLVSGQTVLTNNLDAAVRSIVHAAAGVS